MDGHTFAEQRLEMVSSMGYVARLADEWMGSKFKEGDSEVRPQKISNPERKERVS